MSSSSSQGSHMYVLTLQNRDRSVCTVSGALTPVPGATRYDLYLHLRSEMVRHYPSMEDGSVTFFSLEPNQI
ncbi:hypothetical protein ACIQK6_17575 [Streptomyces sp. NPDC091682]|uniref:hypothetical protein n=1 Tax=Streptomyces sp. NPDC091682 TaxID=3366005 RepID=UPI0038102151